MVNTFTMLRVEQFPSSQKFAVYAALIDGLGDATIDLLVLRLETNEVVYTFRNRIHFPDRLVEVRTLIRLHECSFPAPGLYQLTILIDGEWIAHRHLQVVGKGGSS